MHAQVFRQKGTLVVWFDCISSALASVLGIHGRLCSLDAYLGVLQDVIFHLTSSRQETAVAKSAATAKICERMPVLESRYEVEIQCEPFLARQ
jgi:hypothetical protein